MTSVLSIVVPFFNVELYLEACLDSLAAQTLRDIEVIMVDDGSTDGSAAIAERFAAQDPRFRFMRQENQGLGPARNTGAGQATGAYLAFADSDDVITRHAYELMVGSLEETGSDLACGGVRRIGPTGLESSPLHTPLFRVTRKKTHVREFRDLLVDRTAWNKVFRRAFWDEHAFEFPPGMYEDAPVTIPAHILAGSVDVLREPVYYWRLRQTGERSITERRTEIGNLEHRMRSIGRVRDFIAGQAPDLKADFDRLVLDSDVRIFLKVFSDADEAWHARFAQLVGEYLRDVDDDIVAAMPVTSRLTFHAIRDGLLPELRQIVAFSTSDDVKESGVIRRGWPRAKWYGDYPFFGDSRFPAHLYELRDELKLTTAIDKISWRAGRLRVEGHAYIAKLDAPSRKDTRIKIEVRRKKGDKTVVVTPEVERIHRPDVTADTGQPVACHDWSGFAFELDPAELGTGRATWEAHVEIETRGVRRNGPLERPKGGAWWPPTPESSPGVRLTPRYAESRYLTLAVHPIRAMVTAARIDDQVLELAGWVPGKDPAFMDDAILKLDLRQGSTAVELPVTYAPAEEGRVGFRVSVPLSDIAKEAGPSNRSDTLDWDLWLVGPDGSGRRLAIDADSAGARTAVAGHEYAVVRTRYGNVTVVERAPRLTVTGLTWDADALRITGSCTGEDLRPDRLVLRRRRSSDSHEAAVTWDGEAFTAVVAMETTDLRGTLPLPSGSWDLFAPVPAGDVPVFLDTPSTDSLPEPRVSGVHELAVRTYRDDHLQLWIRTALREDERGPYANRMLQQDYFGSPRKGALRDLVVFDSYFGSQYSCNPAAIHEELRRRDLGFESVWATMDGQFAAPPDARVVLRRTREYYEAMTSARVVVNNCLQPPGYVKPVGQIYLQTWHGTPFKHIGYDLVQGGRIASTTTSVERFEGDVPQWDFLLSPGPHVTEMFRKALRFDCEALEVGYPRNDLLFRPESSARAAQVRSRLGIPDDRRVVLYIPTWREDGATGDNGRHAELLLDTARLAAALGDDHVILSRQHHLVADRTDGVRGDVIDVTRYPDVTELYLIADVVITDYSSAMFDFAVTGRPLLFFTPDLEYYQDELRGCYFDLAAEAPGPLLKTSDEVLEALRDIDVVTKSHEAAYETFRAKYCPVDDGTAAARVVDRIIASGT